MFSWSTTTTPTTTTTTTTNNNNNDRNSGSHSPTRNRISFGGGTSLYPGRRTNPLSESTKPQQPVTVAGQTINGTIRPPLPKSKYTRTQHLQSFLQDATLSRSTRRVSTDDTTYDTVFQTTTGDTLILRVNVPISSTGEETCPNMTLAGVQARHKWLDKFMRIVAYNPIQSEYDWRISNLLLGQAVHAVVKELQLVPPKIIKITDKGLKSIQKKHNNKHVAQSDTNGKHHKKIQAEEEEAPPDYQTMLQNERNNNRHHQNNNNNNNTNNFQPMPKIKFPNIPKTYKEINNCSRDELENLLSNEIDFLQLVGKISIMNELKTLNNKYLNENITLANTNLNYESTLQNKYETIQQLQQQLQKSISTFNELEKEQNNLCKPPNINNIINDLTKQSKVTLEKSEQYAEEWVENGSSGSDDNNNNNNTNVDTFIKEFLNQRKCHHKYAAQVELIKNQQQQQYHHR